MEIVNKNISSIKCNNYGLRKNEMALAPLMKSIQEFGFVQPIIIDKNNNVICGNTRVEAARLMNVTDVPTIQLELNETQAKKLALIDNQIQQLSGWNYSRKKKIVEEANIDTSVYGLSDEMRSIADIDAFFAEDNAISLFDL